MRSYRNRSGDAKINLNLGGAASEEISPQKRRAGAKRSLRGCALQGLVRMTGKVEVPQWFDELSTIVLETRRGKRIF